MIHIPPSNANSRSSFQQDLCAAFQGAFEEGIQGLILWSPDKQPWADRCPAIKNYVQTTLGPVARNIQKKAEKCSRRLCSGRGSCLRAGDLLLEWVFAICLRKVSKFQLQMEHEGKDVEYGLPL